MTNWCTELEYFFPNRKIERFWGKRTIHGWFQVCPTNCVDIVSITISSNSIIHEFKKSWSYWTTFKQKWPCLFSTKSTVKRKKIVRKALVARKTSGLYKKVKSLLFFAAYAKCKKNYSFSMVVFPFFQTKIANSFYSKINDSGRFRATRFSSSRLGVRVTALPKIFTIYP